MKKTNLTYIKYCFLFQVILICLLYIKPVFSSELSYYSLSGGEFKSLGEIKSTGSGRYTLYKGILGKFSYGKNIYKGSHTYIFREVALTYSKKRSDIQSQNGTEQHIGIDWLYRMGFTMYVFANRSETLVVQAISWP